jgi:hypothetical protein
MATATKPKKTPGKAPPTPQVPPPANETRVLPDGTIERYKDGQLIKTTPPPKANGQATPTPAVAVANGNPSKAKPPTPAAVTPSPKPGEAFYVAKLGTEDIWQLAPLSAKPGAAVIVRHFTGYDVVSEQRYTATLADKLYHELIDERGFTYIDGVTHKLVDEDA